MSKPIVLIVGKPNVGKSTLFNRIIGEKKAIVLDSPGVTRDHIYGEARWDERAFTLIDTCGIFEKPETIIESQLKDIVIKTLKESSVVLFVVDGKNGLTSEDFHVLEILRKANSKVIVVANKAESFDKYELNMEFEFFKLGYGEPIPVSAEHNKNIHELMDKIIENLEEQNTFNDDEDPVEENENSIKVAIVGRPNAGKSSLFNTILGMEKAIVSNIPGTTRDVVDQKVILDDIEFLFIDTAGIRRKKTIDYGSIEMFAVIRTIKAIERADVVIFVIDSIEGITQQDKKVAGIAENRGKGTVVAFNKWDLVESSKKGQKDFIKYFEKEMFFIDYSPVVFTSATEKIGITQLIDSIKEAQESRTRNISTSLLNSALERYVMLTPPPVKKGKRIKFYFAKQVGTKPPVFSFQTNSPGEVPNSYIQGLRNMIRKYLDPFKGSPVYIKIEGKNK